MVRSGERLPFEEGLKLLKLFSVQRRKITEGMRDAYKIINGTEYQLGIPIYPLIEEQWPFVETER